MENILHMILAGVILTIVLIVFTLGKSPFFRVDRAGVAIIGAVAMIATGVLPGDKAAAAVDYKTVIILFSMMILVANLKLAGFFEFVGNNLLRLVSSKRSLLFAVVLVSGVLSAFVINDIVCLLFTPIVLLLCRKVDCNPVPNLLGVAMASNIGSAATLLGNPQNVLVGSLSGMPFMAYFLTAAPVAVVGLLCTFGVIAFYYRRELQGGWGSSPQIPANVHMYLIGKSLLILAVILILYLAGYDLAMVASLGAAVSLMTRRVEPNKVYASVDFNLLVIFIGLFIIIAGVEESGLVTYLFAQFSFSKVNDLGVFAVVTVALSNLVSNVPAVLLLRFLIPDTQVEMWWKALALFSTLAGNLTIAGSIANLIVVEMGKRNQVYVSAKDYFRIGFPLTLLVTSIGILWLTFVR
ncbi:SLC13 family permease [Azotosporobacter soli]|uniref:SLC13 family permease n=1 Tax=Azotosporobacter soli TaxID=3055040 RepID=UPI0031FED7EC